MPPEELTEVQRVCFQIEAAHWFYEDFIRPHNAHLPTFHMRAFSELVFNSVPLLAHFAKRQAYDSFLKYKLSVPVCGAILVSEDWKSCLVVKGMKSSNWGFPQGKINQAETEMDCAIREVWEEVGYDISPYFDPSRAHQPFNSHAPPPPLVEQVYPHVQFIEREVSSKRIRLYIIPGVPVSTAFETKTRGEIAV
ncbi:mRNA-decapping enzyme subunit 2 [Cystobasidiomycetes sp. EMM_F5]